jgi:large subunit ribosomal protein L15
MAMTELSNLKAPEGAVRNKKRVGRGESSGLGKTSGKGSKGQKSRQGTGKPGRGRAYEGGQMPLARRLPKRGFISRNRVEYAIINIGQLAEVEANSVVDINFLRERGMIKKGYDLLKVLGDGELNVALTVYADKFSKSASERITAAGGQAKPAAEQQA